MTTNWKFTFNRETRKITSELIDNLIGDSEEYEDLFEEDFEDTEDELIELFDMIGGQVISDYLYDVIEEMTEDTTVEEIIEEFNLPETITFTDGNNKYDFDVEVGVDEFLHNYEF